MEFIGLFSSICIGVAIVAYFEGRRVGRNQGFKKGFMIGHEVGIFIGNANNPEDARLEVLRDLSLEVH